MFQQNVSKLLKFAYIVNSSYLLIHSNQNQSNDEWPKQSAKYLSSKMLIVGIDQMKNIIIFNLDIRFTMTTLNYFKMYVVMFEMCTIPTFYIKGRYRKTKRQKRKKLAGIIPIRGGFFILFDPNSKIAMWKYTRTAPITYTPAQFRLS